MQISHFMVMVLVLLVIEINDTWLGRSLIFKSFHTVRILNVIPVGITMHMGRVKMYDAAVRFLGIQVLRDTVYELKTYPPVTNKTPTGITEKMNTTTTVAKCINLVYPVR